ncbi:MULTISPECIES: ATP-binding protein [unclassified Chryseobacterium]|uniref:tetratricopeptide repeat-containing sensor histidine kinase n=1 Tax=unclassified Chryseobacterium TaxID=2593645 RepID=UPI00226A3DC6|nr:MULTISPECIES: ATP-binding protein [unclassified Chryseobacterium]
MIRYIPFLVFFLFSCKENPPTSSDALNGDKLYNEGIKLLSIDDVNAYLKFQQAIDYYSNKKDSSNISKSLICQAIAQKNRGDLLGAEETLVEAMKHMKDGDESFYSVYDTMANLKSDQKEYKDAIKWYDKALSVPINSEENRNNILCNKAASEFKLNNYSKALTTLRSINSSDLKLNNRIKTLIEYVKWLDNKSYNPQTNMLAILDSKLQNNDLWGANSSYAHLAEINEKTNPALSLFYAKEMYNVAIKIKSPEDKLEAVERIILVDNPSNSKNMFLEYKTLDDSIQTARNTYKNRFAFIKYDTEKKEVDNQRLRNDKIEDQNSILRLYIGTAILIVIIIIIIVLYRRRQLKLKLEVKNTQLKMSKKVHDVVANGIYQVMTKIENQEHFDKDEALDELEYVYEKSRDISYEKNEIKDIQPFDEKISALIASFKNDTVNTYVAGNGKQIWENLPASSKDEVYQIIRELLVNMKKHSQASTVAFKFEKLKDSITIQYTDNGIGISGDLIRKNGLTNTGTRIEAIQGKIIFETNIEKGLKIYISFPTS